MAPVTRGQRRAAEAAGVATSLASVGSSRRRWILSEEALAHLAAYKYSAGPSTVLDRLFNHYWNWAVDFLPTWLAPNLVTLLGLLWMVVSAAVVVWQAPSLTEPLSPAVCWSALWCLFAYQTMDALDGKQARRTGTSSPLGQLFDHGCDALNTVFTCTILAATWRLGGHPWLMMNMLFNVFAAFFMGQWEEYHTGMMRTNNGYVGVTEGQLVHMGIELLTAVCGAEVWDWEVAMPGDRSVTLKTVSMVLGTLLTLWVSVSSVWRVLVASPDVRTGKLHLAEEWGDKHLGRRAAVLQLVPILLSFALGGMWTVGHGEHVFNDHPVGVIFGLGVTMAYLSTRMTVSHVAKLPFGVRAVAAPILLQLLAVLNTYWQVLRLPRLPWAPLSDGVVMWLYVGAISLVYLRYVLGAIWDICHYLNIRCLHITPKVKAL